MKLAQDWTEEVKRCVWNQRLGATVYDERASDELYLIPLIERIQKDAKPQPKKVYGKKSRT